MKKLIIALWLMLFAGPIMAQTEPALYLAADKEKMKEKESSLKIQGAKTPNAEKVHIPIPTRFPNENDEKFKGRLQTYLVNFLTC